MAKRIYHPDHGYIMVDSAVEIQKMLDSGGQIVEGKVSEFEKKLRAAEGRDYPNAELRTAEAQDRELALNDREASLDEREKILLLREKDITDKEASVAEEQDRLAAIAKSLDARTTEGAKTLSKSTKPKTENVDELIGN